MHIGRWFLPCLKRSWGGVFHWEKFWLLYFIKLRWNAQCQHIWDILTGIVWWACRDVTQISTLILVAPLCGTTSCMERKYSGWFHQQRRTLTYTPTGCSQENRETFSWQTMWKAARKLNSCKDIPLLFPQVCVCVCTFHDSLVYPFDLSKCYKQKKYMLKVFE